MSDGIVCIFSVILSTIVNYCIKKHVVNNNIILLFNDINTLMIGLCFICIFMLMVIKSNLPDNLEYRSYKFWSLKEYIRNENNIYKKNLAKLYILIDKPAVFCGGWIFGIMLVSRI